MVYICPDEAYSEGLCKFHNKEYSHNEKNKKELTELLKQKVADANASGSPLKWIGYQIPADIPTSHKFKVSVYLDYANFIGNADFFRESTFERSASFSNANFEEETYFGGATFRGKVNFSDANFKNEASFRSANFNGKANFVHTSFNGKLDLFGASFNGMVSFGGATFEEVVFSRVTFSGKVEFSYANFKKEVSFSSVPFNGRAIFDFTSFNRSVMFRYAKFKEEALFSNANFKEEVDFHGAKFIGIVFFIDNSIEQNIIFSSVLLKGAEEVVFNGDLSKVSFANTDITRVTFGDTVVWGRKKGNSENVKSKEEAANDKNKLAKEGEADFKVYDERIMAEDVKKKNEQPTNSLQAVIAEYRNLRENYEYNLRYEEAGQFFIREMELRRKYKQKESSLLDNKIEKKSILERIFSFAALYYFVCNYGESTRRPLIITASVFLIATLYFWYLDGWSMDTETISDSISRTATAFFPFFSLPENYGFLDVILRATMIPMAGILFIALRRKLERRFRH